MPGTVLNTCYIISKQTRKDYPLDKETEGWKCSLIHTTACWVESQWADHLSLSFLPPSCNTFSFIWQAVESRREAEPEARGTQQEMTVIL